MIKLPDFRRAFEYENDFYLSCDKSRLSKVLAHYELYKLVQNLPGAIVECGVFKGVSLARFAMMRDLFGPDHGKKIVGFDIFGKFPETRHDGDKPMREKFIAAAGDESISIEQMREVLAHKGVGGNIELIGGDITTTLPDYVAAHPEFRISLLNLDTDIYEPAVTILDLLYPRLVPGGILILDDYGVFPGETDAVNEYFAGKNVLIEKFPFAATPCFIRKTVA